MSRNIVVSIFSLLPVAGILTTLFTSVLALWKWRSGWKAVGVLLLMALALLLLGIHDWVVEPPTWDGPAALGGFYVFAVLLGLCSIFFLAIHALMNRRRKP
jgi:hypothetical protein